MALLFGMGAAVAAHLLGAPLPPLATAPAVSSFNFVPGDLSDLHFALGEPDSSAQQQGHSHQHHHDDEAGHSHENEFHASPPSLGFDLFSGWFDPWTHGDYSRLGTPFVHLFLSEPAYLDRDLFLDFGWFEGDEGAEYEIEAEVEYAFTRRIGVVIEAPVEFLNPEEGPSERGLGDIAVAPRFLLAEYDRFLLSANIEVSVPTGDEDRGLGAGEVVLGPSLSTWLDLGSDVTFQGNFGFGQGLSSDTTAMTWGAALAWSLYVEGKPTIINAEGGVRTHFPVGLLSLIAELRGEHPFDGEDEGNGTATAVLGASYTFAPSLEFRAGFAFPAWNPREFDHGVIAGVIWHF